MRRQSDRAVEAIRFDKKLPTPCKRADRCRSAAKLSGCDWIPNHTPRVFVEKVDFVSGVGYDRAAAAGAEIAGRHHLARVIANLAVLEYETPDGCIRLRSLHPGVTLERLVESTGFQLAIPEQVPESRCPTPEELDLIRSVLDPQALRKSEVPA